MNIEFGGLNIEMRKRAGPRDKETVAKIRDVVGRYPDAKDLALVLRSSGVSAVQAQYLSATLSYDTNDREAALLFERMQVAAAKVSAWETDGFIEEREDSLTSGRNSLEAGYARGDGEHRSLQRRLGQGDDE